MAKKRIIRTGIQDDDVNAKAEGGRPNADPTWSEWCKGTYLLYWYAITVIALDIFIILQANASLDWPVSLYVASLTLVVLIFVQYNIFVRLWGRNGKWIY